MADHAPTRQAENKIFRGEQMKQHILAGGKLHEVDTPEYIYTREDWEFDGTFKPLIGQEISADIYEQMYNCLPPLDLNGGKLARDLGIVGGFRVGEPTTYAKSAKTGKFTAFYGAFGRTRNGEKFYFLGDMNKYGEIYEDATGQILAND
ncbi:MAG: hypothetical protein NC131_01235 [Roseburia sp.]|nr:hypothetical protein [Roseburia sp.]